MRASTIFAGFVGGAALALSLAAPLYVGLPSRYLAEWSYMTTEGSIWGFLAAMVVVVGAGAFSAFLQEETPIGSGALTGTITVLVGGFLMVLPSTSLEAVSDLINFVEVGGDGRVDEFGAAALVSAAWLPSSVGAMLLIAGPAFGAMGGVGLDLWRDTPSAPTNHAVKWSPVPGVVLLSGVLWGAAQMLGIRQIQAVHREAELALSGVDTLKLSVPTATLGVFTIILLGWAVRDAVVLYRGGKRLRGATWAAGSVGLGLVILAEGMVLVPANLSSPVVWSVVAVGIVSTATVLFRAARSDEYLDQEGTSVVDLMSQGLLAGALVLGQGLFAGGSAAIAAGAVVLPWLQTVDGAVAPAASELLVSRVFQIHWVAGVGVLVLALIYVVVLAPLWVMRRAVRRR